MQSFREEWQRTKSEFRFIAVVNPALDKKIPPNGVDRHSILIMIININTRIVTPLAGICKLFDRMIYIIR